MTTAKENLMQLWQTLSRKILASILVDAGAIFPVMEIIQHNYRWFSPRERLIYQAALNCVDANVIPTVETVAARLNGTTDISYIMQIASLFNDEDNRRLIYNAEELKQLGILVRVKQLGKQLNELDTPDKIAETLDETNTELTGLFADKNDRQSDSEAVDSTAWAMADQFKGNSIPTGLPWFDNLSGGLWPGMNYWIAAAYKSGKSTIMRNMVLSAAKAGWPVAAYCAEGTREVFTLDCQAMLATYYYLQNGGPRDKCRLNGLFLLRSWAKHRDERVFSELEYEAINEARRQWRTLPIRVYDTKDSIRGLATLHYDIKRDKMRYGTMAAYLDYSQLFGGNSGTLFERQSKTALKVQEIAQNEGVVMVALAQRNESSIHGGGDNYSVGVKGGGDASAAADGLFVPSIDPEIPYQITVTLKFSRHTRTGEGIHTIEPSSGLITGQVKPAVNV